MLALAVLGSLASPQSPAPQAPGPLLRIDLVALDDHEKLVTDLSPKDLDIRIENYHVPVGSLTAAVDAGSERGRLIVLVLDDLAVPLDLTPRVREAAHRFVARMEAGERMAIVSLNGDRMEATADHARLNQRIDAYTVKAAPVQRFDDVGAHVFETMTDLARQMAEDSPGRKTVVGLGAGWLFDTPVPPATGGRNLRAEWTAAMRAMGFANVVLYAIDPGGIGTSRFGGADGIRAAHRRALVRQHQRRRGGGGSHPRRGARLLHAGRRRSARRPQVRSAQARDQVRPQRRDDPGPSVDSRHGDAGAAALTPARRLQGQG